MRGGQRQRSGAREILRAAPRPAPRLLRAPCPCPFRRPAPANARCATSSIDFRFSMCAENVERSAAMDCSSPISASTRSKTGSSARSRRHGNARLRREHGEADGFERDRLAAGVRPADDQHGFRRRRARASAARRRGPAAAAWLRARDGARLRAQMSCPRESGMHASNSRAKRARAKSESRCGDGSAAASSGPRSARTRAVKFFEDARDLGGFFVAELHQAIIQIDAFRAARRRPSAPWRWRRAPRPDAAAVARRARESRSGRCGSVT